MHPENVVAHQEQGVPPPQITQVEHPVTHEIIKQELRFSADGKPSEMFMYDAEGNIVAYENITAMQKIQIEEIQRQMFLKLHSEREHYSKQGPVKL
jgi:hypothetical protein